MNVLFPVSELAKVYHLGGLGDIAYSLPRALRQSGLDVRVALPFHPGINLDHLEKQEEISVNFDHQVQKIDIFHTLVPDTKVPLYLFANQDYLSKPSGVGDEATTKFAFFSLAVSAWLLAKTSAWQPDIIHLNDWHVALIPSILRHRFQVKCYKTLLTIHNLNFQGTAPQDLSDKLHIEPCTCRVLTWDKSDGDINLLMQGIIHADWVNAVSPNYAKEILTDEYGAFLNPVITSLKGKLSGILNGIDIDEWNPQTDPHIHNFDFDNLEAGKTINKTQLLNQLNIESDDDSLLVSYIGRVDPNQKGVQLIIQALRQNLIGTKTHPFVFLGTGDESLENQIQELAFNNPFIHAVCKFDMPLSHQLYAASDLILIPSKYEPCGLVQMIAMRYATIPLVRRTGGLADSVEHDQTGFLFNHYDVSDFINSLIKSLEKLSDKKFRLQLQQNCFTQDFSWNQSAKQYIKTYQKIIKL